MRRPILAVLAAVLGVALWGCGGGSSATVGPFSGAEVTVQAINIAFEPGEVQLPAGTPLRIVLDNRDAGVPHDIRVTDGDRVLGQSPTVTGPGETEVRFGPLSPGTYRFACAVHPSMTGTLTVTP